MAARDVLILAGEASGDLHAAALVEAWHPRPEGLAFAGLGGARMAAAGVELLAPMEGVVGFVEVLRHIPAHWRLLRALRERLATGRVGLVILVDYPGFNMRVAGMARSAGVPVLYYITPQVWAWRAGRLRNMAQVITRAAVILPFEEALLRGAGIAATFVGHPLLDRALTMPDRGEARRRLGLGPGPVLALFPGSRPEEIARHLDGFLAVARTLEPRHPGLEVVISGAATVRLPPDVPYRVVPSASLEVLRAADVALCKSGTTTLEAAVAGCPCAIVYRTSAVSYFIARRLVTIQDIGLLNIVAGRRVVPEFVQHEFVPAAVADALDPLFDAGSPARRAMVKALGDVRARLGEPGAAGRVARIAAEMLA
jgi:lipid-A-disaccharide synthase